MDRKKTLHHNIRNVLFWKCVVVFFLADNLCNQPGMNINLNFRVQSWPQCIQQLRNFILCTLFFFPNEMNDYINMLCAGSLHYMGGWIQRFGDLIEIMLTLAWVYLNIGIYFQSG